MKNILIEKLFNQILEPIFQSNNLLTKYSALKQRKDEFKSLFNIELAGYVGLKKRSNSALKFKSNSGGRVINLSKNWSN